MKYPVYVMFLYIVIIVIAIEHELKTFEFT